MLDPQILVSDVPQGSEATFLTQFGREHRGVVLEYGATHIRLQKPNGEVTTIALATIAEWTRHAAEFIRPAVDSPPSSSACPNPVPTIDIPPASTNSPSDETPTAIQESQIEIEWRNKRMELERLIADAALTVDEPDFAYPSSDLPQSHQSEPRKVWKSVRDAYIYAKGINELGSDFGRIQPRVADMRQLAKDYPESAAIAIHLAFFEQLAGDRKAAVDSLLLHLRHSPGSIASHQLAKCAAVHGNHALAASALMRFPAFLEDSPQKGASILWYYVTQQAITHQATSVWAKWIETQWALMTESTRPMVVETLILAISRMVDAAAAAQLYKAYTESGCDAIVGECLARLKSLDTEPSGAFLAAREQVNASALPAPPKIRQSPIQRINFRGKIGQAEKFADRGSYGFALQIVNRIILNEPENTHAKSLQTEWKRKERIKGLPKGSGPYAQAKRAHLADEDLDAAAKYYQEAIETNDNAESAVKDLALLYGQQGKAGEGVKVLKAYKSKVLNLRSWENTLLSLTQRAGDHKEAIKILEKRLHEVRDPRGQASIRYQIAVALSRGGKYIEAEPLFRKLLDDTSEFPNPARRALAVCLLQQDRRDEAVLLLKQNIKESNDRASEGLLQTIESNPSGQAMALDDPNVWEQLRPDLSSEVGTIAAFLLSRCEYEGLTESRKKEGKENNFTQDDVTNLESFIERLGKGRPRDRALACTTAAKICGDLGDDAEARIFLARALASFGDASVAEGKPLDSLRDAYIEALTLFELSNPNRPESRNSLCRYILSFIGARNIPLDADVPSLDDALQALTVGKVDPTIVLRGFSLLVCQSRFATSLLTKAIAAAPQWKLSLSNFLSRKVSSADTMELSSFWMSWAETRCSSASSVIEQSLKLAWESNLQSSKLEDAAKQIPQNTGMDFLVSDLDCAQVRKIRDVIFDLKGFDAALSFEDKERILRGAEGKLQELLDQIEDAPTILALESYREWIQKLIRLCNGKLAEIEQANIPRIECRLPSDLDHYTPDSEGSIEVQIVITNDSGCSPADSVSIDLDLRPDIYTADENPKQLAPPLRGGAQEIVRFNLKLSPAAIEESAFTLGLKVRYKMRSGVEAETQNFSLAVTVSDPGKFEPIPNPYSPESGPVHDPKMFFGRDEFLNAMVSALCAEDSAGKCFLIYGQKRVGKTSILWHLERRLEREAGVIPVSLGNIGSFLDPEAPAPFLHQFIWQFLAALKDACDDLATRSDVPAFEIEWLTSKDFYGHPAPLTEFSSFMKLFQRRVNLSGVPWTRRIVLLVDEFSYLYNLIIAKTLPDTFMKSWKAWLQEGYFAAVLVGQDVMPKFKRLFPNEFGVSKDERISQLSTEAAQALIDEPIRIGGRAGSSRYRENALERAIELTGGSPFYIQIFCDRLVSHMNRRRMSLVTEANITDVLNELVSGERALDETKFDNLVDDGDSSPDRFHDVAVWTILTRIAHECERSSGPSSLASLGTLPARGEEILKALTDRDVVEQNQPGFYSIRVKLFHYWLVKRRAASR